MQVAIVGAGIIGYAVAHELATRGAHVQLFDPRGSGQGATRASAGILAPHVEGHTSELLHLARCSLDRYDAFVQQVTAQSRRSIEYRRLGTLQVARTEEEERTLEETSRALTRRVATHICLDGEGVRRLEPSLAADVRAGLLVAEHGYVGVATLMAALEEATRKQGVALERSAVDRIEVTDSPIVHAGRQQVAVDAVVLAAGSWSGRVPIAHLPAPPVRPVRGQLLQLRFANPPLTHIVWGSAAYLVPWTDGSLLVGATVEDVGFDDRVTAAGVHDLLDAASALLPPASAAGFVEARAGLRPATTDELPIVGRSSTMRGVYYATGHYRNGVLLAPLTASLLADLVLEGREHEELALMRPDRFAL